MLMIESGAAEINQTYICAFDAAHFAILLWEVRKKH